jgi:hypothetical protein
VLTGMMARELGSTRFVQGLAAFENQRLEPLTQRVLATSKLLLTVTQTFLHRLSIAFCDA